MSDYKPITGELRGMMFITESEQGTPMVELGWFRFKQLCDAIDAIHARLERENAELRERLAKMDNRGGSMHIGEATVTVKPTLDWSGVAQELRAIADTLAGDAE